MYFCSSISPEKEQKSKAKNWRKAEFFIRGFSVIAFSLTENGALILWQKENVREQIYFPKRLLCCKTRRKKLRDWWTIVNRIFTENTGNNSLSSATIRQIQSCGFPLVDLEKSKSKYGASTQNVYLILSLEMRELKESIGSKWIYTDRRDFVRGQMRSEHEINFSKLVII